MKLNSAPKPSKRIKTKKRINRIKKTPMAKLKREADKLAGAICRARGKCEACGSKNKLQWSHIISRTYHSIRWLPQNCICLCAPCHFKFTYRPDYWISWLMINLQDTYLWLYSEKNKYVKINRSFMEKTIDDLKLQGGIDVKYKLSIK